MTKMKLILRLTILFQLMVLSNGKLQISPQMLNATTLEEFWRANNPITSTEAKLWRRQGLQRLQIDDSEMILADKFNNTPGFYHGVASGDPLPDSVIVWTRYTPLTKEETVKLELRIAAVNTNLSLTEHLNPDKNTNLRRATVEVTKKSDFIAKIDVVGLESKTNYVYAFSDGVNVSQIGQTKTAPAPTDKVTTMRYAFFTCSQFTNGYFHAYDVASTIQNLDFWVHTGDYVYEFGTYSTYGADAKERIHLVQPPWEPISLQDYRNRMATYHTDKGLQNLRRRAPMIAIWDDHDLSDNAYGQGSASNTGAENHQPTCSANPFSSQRRKNRLQCDRDEGDAVQRFNAAARSFFEWLPIRHHPGSMGVVEIGSLNRVISWGDMATFVAVDTRISYRSKEPTIQQLPVVDFVGAVLLHRDVREYSNRRSRAYKAIMRVAKKSKKKQEDPTLTMIGENIEIIRSAFADSKTTGQPWQIWVASTAFGRSILGDFFNLDRFISDASLAGKVMEENLKLHNSLSGIVPRIIYASAISRTPWNSDDFSGFAHEQKSILQMFKENASNPIVLGGDLHDSYGWQIFEHGKFHGTPAAVNLITPGVTNQGWGPILNPAYRNLAGPLGGMKSVFDLLQRANEGFNPGLKYVNFQHRGFVAVTVTKSKHIAEYFGFTPETILTPYGPSNATAPFFCNVQLTTTAGQPGSLTRSDECGATQFDISRPEFWSIKFPTASQSPASTFSKCGYRQCMVNFSLL